MAKTEKHIFQIEDAVLDTLTVEEVGATARGMDEMGILRMPFDYGVSIRVSRVGLIRLLGQEDKILVKPGTERDHFEMPLSTEFVNDDDRKNAYIRIIEPVQKGFDPKTCALWQPDFVFDKSRSEVLVSANWDNSWLADDGKNLEGPVYYWNTETGRLLRDLLIVVLATRGFSKTEIGRQTKLQKLQGKNKDGTVITHIEVDPRFAAALGGSHASPRMHLRRGHPRRFRNGVPLEKPIWIEATLVCADADFMVTRTAYTVH